MKVCEDLRNEARRLIEATPGFIDPEMKKKIAAQAFELAQWAECIEQLPDREFPRSKIAQYKSILTQGTNLNPEQRRLVNEALTDAE